MRELMLRWPRPKVTWAVFGRIKATSPSGWHTGQHERLARWPRGFELQYICVFTCCTSPTPLLISLPWQTHPRRRPCSCGTVCAKCASASPLLFAVPTATSLENRAARRRSRLGAFSRRRASPITPTTTITSTNMSTATSTDTRVSTQRATSTTRSIPVQLHRVQLRAFAAPRLPGSVAAQAVPSHKRLRPSLQLPIQARMATSHPPRATIVSRLPTSASPALLLKNPSPSRPTARSAVPNLLPPRALAPCLLRQARLSL